MILLEKWLECDAKSKKEASNLMPKRVKRRRQITSNQVQDVDAASAQEEGWEEYYDLIFPDDELAKEQ